MVDGVSGNLSTLEQYRLKNEYQEVIDALKEAYPDMTEAELEQAMMNYLEAHSSDKLSGLNVLELINQISEALNVSLSAEAAATIKDEWEDLTQSLDIGVSDLVDILDSYGQSGAQTSRAYKVMVWQMLQGELEETQADEAKEVAKADKALQESTFDEYIEKTLTSIADARTAEGWTMALKWAGSVASLIGGMVTSAIGGVMLVAAGWTGLGAIAGACMIGAGFISMGAGTSALVGVIAETAGGGENWSLERRIGQLVGVIAQAIDPDVDVDAVIMWSAMAVQAAVLYASVSLSVAGGAFSLINAGGVVASSSVKAAADTANVAREAAQKAADMAEIAHVCGDCWELLKAAEEAAAIAVETAKIAQLAKLEQAMSIVSNLTTVFSATASVASAGVSIGKTASTTAQANSRAELVLLQAAVEKMSDIVERDQELTQNVFEIVFQNIRGQVTNAVDTVLKDLEIAVSMNLNKA